MTQHTVRFGVIGAGRIARNKVGPAIKSAESAILHAAASRDLARAESLGPVRAYGSYDDVIRDPDVDAVYIATHNGLHRDLAISALQTGKHVLCEKPLAVNARECKEIIDTAASADCHLVEAFMYRYHPQLAEVQGLVRAGAIGDLMVVEASFRVPMRKADDVRLRPEWGGGALLDVGCYCVNVSRLFLGDTPQRVQALASFDAVHGVDTSVQGVLDYGSGRFAVISCGFDGGLHQTVALIGTGGVVSLNQPFIPSKGEPRLTILRSDREEVIPLAHVNTYRSEIEDFALAVLNGSPPQLKPDEGFLNAQVLDRIAANISE